ncbi:UNVERIFIED_CONTAM: hypothetical protein FKN15_046876 [Acipenser sinensis]
MYLTGATRETPETPAALPLNHFGKKRAFDVSLFECIFSIRGLYQDFRKASTDAG